MIASWPVMGSEAVTNWGIALAGSRALYTETWEGRSEWPWRRGPMTTRVGRSGDAGDATAVAETTPRRASRMPANMSNSCKAGNQHHARPVVLLGLGDTYPHDGQLVIRLISSESQTSLCAARRRWWVEGNGSGLVVSVVQRRWCRGRGEGKRPTLIDSGKEEGRNNSASDMFWFPSLSSV